MFKKKNLVVNCNVCDTRKVKQEELEGYEQIIINADIILVNERSKGVLNQLGAICNADEMTEIEEEVDTVTINGNYEINGNTRVEGKVLLSVNGNLVIRPGTEEILKKYVKISVNGSVQCPESLAAFLDKLSVNGSLECIPDGCIHLKEEFPIDRYFPLRARENGKYYAGKKVLLLDPEADVEKLAEKKVQFVTKTFVCAEELIDGAVSLFDESVEFQIIPKGYAFVEKSAVLNGSLLKKYGNCLYIDGDLTLDPDSTPLIGRIEKLIVKGKILLSKEQAEALKAVDAEYEDLVLVKGKIIQDKLSFTLDRAVVQNAPEGISVRNCVSVTIKEEVEAEEIQKLLDFQNCVRISCTPEQRGAVELVSRNVVSIDSGEGGEGESEVPKNPWEMLKSMAESKLINADKYLL